jgi:hypothetical protein
MSRLNAFGWSRIAALAAILAVAAYRLTPHLPNFTPIGAMFLLGGFYLGRSLRWMAVPFAALLVSDVAIYLAWNGSFFAAGHLFEYAAFALVGLAARFAGRRGLSWKIGAIAAAPLIFFLVSNFGVWASGPGYPHTLSGLIACYVAGVPFIRGTALGDWLFAGAVTAAIEFARRARPAVPARA